MFRVLEWLECSPSTTEVAGFNQVQGALCWKFGSYLPMPGGLQYRILVN